MKKTTTETEPDISFFEEMVPIVDEERIPHYRYDRDGVCFELKNKTVAEIRAITARIKISMPGFR